MTTKMGVPTASLLRAPACLSNNLAHRVYGHYINELVLGNERSSNRSFERVKIMPKVYILIDFGCLQVFKEGRTMGK